MKIIANQCFSPLEGAGYDSPKIKVVNLKVEAGSAANSVSSVSSVSVNQTEVWDEEEFKW